MEFFAWMQQGVHPFVFTLCFMLAGLLLALVSSIRLNAEKSAPFVRAGNAVAITGTLFGFQFRRSEWVYGESLFGRTDSLPGPAAILLLLGVYTALLALCTSYIQYRKSPQEPQLTQAWLKTAVTHFVLLAVIFTVALLMEWLQPMLLIP